MSRCGLPAVARFIGAVVLVGAGIVIASTMWFLLGGSPHP